MHHLEAIKYAGSEIQDQCMAEQCTIFDQTIELWKGDLEQLDDILIIGRRF